MAVKTPTIYDVAALSGVSAATVSRVLNDPSHVKEDKRQKVLEAIKELNFVPKADAVAVARKLYRKVCVIAPFFTQSAFMERLRGVESVLSPEHIEIVIYSIEGKDDLRDYISTLVVNNRVDGLIVFSLNPEEESLELLRKASFPVCFVEGSYEDFDTVIVNNISGGKKAAEYFYNKGCRHPGFFGEESFQSYTLPVTKERLTGYKEFFSNAGIDIKPSHIQICEFDSGKLDESINAYLAQEELPDCVFCSSDLIAARFIAICVEKGISVGRDIKVLGFDNIDIADYIGLSSVSQSLDDSGKMAANLILNRLQGGDREAYSMNAPVKVIERKTT